MSEGMEEVKTLLRTVGLDKDVYISHHLAQFSSMSTTLNSGQITEYLIEKLMEEAGIAFDHYDLHDAIKIYKKALIFAEADEKYEKAVKICFHIATTYVTLKDFKDANEYFEKANNLIDFAGSAAFGTTHSKQEQIILTPPVQSSSNLIKRYYSWILIASMLSSIIIIILLLFTKTTILFIALQIPVIILYAATQRFTTQGNNVK